MRFRDLRDIDREAVSDFIWKWRCKVFPSKDAAASEALNVDDDAADSKAAAAAASGKDPAFGTEPTIKTMYEGKNSNTCHFDWVDYPPKQLSKSAARAQDRVAIKVYKIKDRDKPCIGGRYPLKYQEIEVQNLTLVAALEPILKKENVHLDVNDPARFEYPFRGLWFCQDDIIELHKRTESADPLKAYLKLLIRVLDEMFGEMRIKKKNLQASGLVDFKTAWTLFPRGSTVYSFGLNSEFICKIDGTAYIRKENENFLHIKAKIIKFSGEEFVWSDETLAIAEFEGNKPIRELDHYPLEFHPDADDTKKRLTARGRRVLDLQGLQYRCYNGIALHTAGKDIERHNIEGRILIDVVGYNKHHLARGKRENQDPSTKRSKYAFFHPEYDPEYDPDYDPDDYSDEDESEPRTKVKRLGEKDFLKNKQRMAAREQDLCFISGMLGGFALKNKLWVQFYVEDVEPMVWNDTAFSHLVYDDQQKDLVLSFVQNHNPRRGTSLALTPSSDSTATNAGTRAPMEDVVLGKGQGLIILLSGPPGTGKTLTAEAVADRTHRPLFYLQAEDLGINAAALGANLKRVFEMATEWDAVVLLDEADVFMAERNPNDIHRNELVSIFLRELEYFRGIIFLTTNLYKTIDEAFRSRVSLHLLFQSLNREARKTVWGKFLQRLPEQRETEPPADSEAVGDAMEKKMAEKRLDDEDLAELSLWQLNGREIKNAMRMVSSWCDYNNYTMTLQRLESGIRVTSPHASKEEDVDEDLYE